MVNILGPALTTDQICFYLDASAAHDRGFGCIFNNKWIQGDWGMQFMKSVEPSITFLELFALCAGVLTWQSELMHCQITVFCDNMSVVQMINESTSSCKHCMYLISILTLNGLQFNRRIYAQFVKSRDNGLADSLSRKQMNRFRLLGPNMNEKPDAINQLIRPIENIWFN